jgi:hypothetical protein
MFERGHLEREGDAFGLKEVVWITGIFTSGSRRPLRSVRWCLATCHIGLVWHDNIVQFYFLNFIFSLVGISIFFSTRP